MKRNEKGSGKREWKRMRRKWLMTDKYTNAGLKKISGLAAAYSMASGQTDL
jgi:hypothetical protein